VLSTLLGDKALKFKDVPQMKADKSGLENVKGAFVVTKDGDKETEQPLDEYIEKNYASFKPVLLASETKGTPSADTTKSGARMPRQTTSTPAEDKAPESTVVVDRVLSSMSMTPSERRAAAAKK